MKRFSLAAVIALSLALAVTVQSATQPTGALNVPSGMGLELKIAGKTVPVPVPTGKDVPLPAGKYQPASLTCGAIAPTTKEIWSIKCLGPTWGKIANIQVTEGQTTTLEAGPPFTLKTVVYKTETAPNGGKVVPVTLHVYGKAGELYDLNTFRRGALQAPNLTLQIVDEQGKVLASGILPYG